MLSDSSEGIQRITSIVRGLRSFARIESEELEVVDINEVVRFACKLSLNEVRHQAELITDLGYVPSIVGHRGELSQVVVNLLLNAAQAIESGPTKPHNQIRVTTCSTDEGVILTIEDTGPGIPPLALPRVFDPFFTTKSRAAGTGLGLSICADTVRKHFGEITAKSVVGEGTCFRIVLPEDTELRASAPAVSPSPVVARRRCRVLLIDDDDMVRRAFLRILGYAHDTTQAASGDEGLELLRKYTFDIILCDLMMPGTDGPAVYEAALAMDASLASRFVFVSGGAFSVRAREFLDRVQPVFLQKPVSRETLLEVVSRSAPQATTSEE